MPKGMMTLVVATTTMGTRDPVFMGPLFSTLKSNFTMMMNFRTCSSHGGGLVLRARA